MIRKIIGIFVVGILIITGFASIPIQAGPVQQPLTSPDPQIIDMIQQVNESLLHYYHTHLTSFAPRYTGTENSIKASQYIYDEFHAMGLPVEFFNWTFGDFTDRNVVATLHGTDTSSDATFIICAHHDTVHLSQGANDDGSGVTAVLAIAKILSHYSFNYTIRFITFSGEEQGSNGSYMYAHYASYRGDNIVAVISLDEIGYANTTEGGRTFDFYCPERSKWIADFATTVNTLYSNQTNMTTVYSFPHSIAADMKSFNDYSYDAVYATQDDYYVWENSQNDTSDRINWTYFTKATKFLLAVVAEFASIPLEQQVVITKPYRGYLYFFNYPLLPLLWKYYWYSPRGSTFILGRTNLNVNVIPSNDIAYVSFCIDGIEQWWYDGNNSSNFEWTIHEYYNFPLIGRYTVSVYAYTLSGKIASDEMNIMIYLF
jgi:hypothetical protein